MNPAHLRWAWMNDKCNIFYAVVAVSLCLSIILEARSQYRSYQNLQYRLQLAARNWHNFFANPDFSRDGTAFPANPPFPLRMILRFLRHFSHCIVSNLFCASIPQVSPMPRFLIISLYTLFASSNSSINSKTMPVLYLAKGTHISSLGNNSIIF